MPEAIVASESDLDRLADLARGTLRRKRAALVEALAGRVRDHHRVVLRTLPAHVDHLDQTVAEPSA